ncbi:hypothetical protein ABPG75_004462 [Micractinium tetrahymenae]
MAPPGRRHGGRRHRETPPAMLGNLQAAMIHFGPVVPQFGHADGPSCTGGGFFTLADLWQSFEAWSAYGCEVPMRVQVDGTWQEVIQVYTPYLSGIQLFGADHTRRIQPFITPSSSSCGMSSYCTEDEEEGCGLDSADESLGGGASDAASCTSSAYTCSTASTASDSEDGDAEGDADEPGVPGMRCGKAGGAAGGAAPAVAAARRLARAAARGSVLQKQQPLGEPTQPLFEYFEVERPHLRAPLHDVVMELAEGCPELLTLDTRDLHPTSWFAVTWVPVYRIPSIPDPQVSRDLQANFLTFHSLAVPVPRLHATPADLCSLAPLPPLLDPIGAAAVAWRTEVARQQLLAAALSAISAAQAAQQQAAAAAAVAAATAAAAQHAQQAGTAAQPPASPGSPASPMAALAAQLAAAALEGSAAAPAAPPAAQLPVVACCLRPFAFMPYKVSGRTWVDDWNLNRQHLPMIAAAGSWIERRKVQLPDFDFFSHMYRPLPTSHGHYGGGM